VQLIVIVGASAAGLAAAETLRREGYQGRVTIVGDEDHLPYDRPPLSKQVLSGAWPVERTFLRAPQALQSLEAQWHLGRAAVSLDAKSRSIGLDDRSLLHYDGLVIATGVSARHLPFGHDLSGVVTLRSLDDAVGLRDRLLQATSVLVIGAGFLGAEVAAVARQLGPTVTLVDPLPQPMVRQLGHRFGSLVADLHSSHGTTVRTGVGVIGLNGTAGHLRSADLTDGTTLETDLVLVAIGSTPNTSWLTGSGIDAADGVLCDHTLRAAPGVVAAGDVANWHHLGLGRRLRIEHRMNATEQGTAAARTLLGATTAFAPVPYFWSDQYDVKIQAYGRPSGEAEVEVVEGDPAEGRFAAVYREAGRIVAGVTWNLPRTALRMRQLVLDEQLPAEAVET
jgi:NADPH-dependent 2,4-dienoyl-CoA reductase/sulfur reductase-like enzyme